MSIDKFKGFKEACEQDAELLLVSDLRVLGDTIEEASDNISYAVGKGKKIVLASQDIVIQAS